MHLPCGSPEWRTVNRTLLRPERGRSNVPAGLRHALVRGQGPECHGTATVAFTPYSECSSLQRRVLTIHTENAEVVAPARLRFPGINPGFSAMRSGKSGLPGRVSRDFRPGCSETSAFPDKAFGHAARWPTLRLSHRSVLRLLPEPKPGKSGIPGRAFRKGYCPKARAVSLIASSPHRVFPAAT